jgi:argonaute-like protein implicated in RNA metabolism and viral defense
MNKEQYIKRMEELNAQEAAISVNKNLAANSYIRECGVFQVGDAIWYIDCKKERYPGIISEVRVSTWNDIEYLAIKIKKDGTPSQHRLGIWHYADRFEKRG